MPNKNKENLELIDSHCHLDRLDLTSYAGDLSAALAHARSEGVQRFLCVGINLETVGSVLSLAQEHLDIDASVGVHPNEPISALGLIEEEAALLRHVQDPVVVAVGETGLDYYRTKSVEIPLQQERFRRHISVARSCGKPLIVHSRQAKEDTLRILKEEQADAVGGVLHCFTEDLDMAERAIALNFYISFSGILTFKNATQLQEVAQAIPLERILIETDSPYLAPVPFRGKPNEPAYIRYIAEYLAKLRSCEVAEIARITSENFLRFLSSSRVC